jgi:hypothetical protein
MRAGLLVLDALFLGRDGSQALGASLAAQGERHRPPRMPRRIRLAACGRVIAELGRP